MRENQRDAPDRSDYYPKRMDFDRGKKTGLIKEYKAFDHLWADLETRVRVVIAELQAPIIEEQTQNTVRCQKIKKTHAGTHKELKELQALVLQQEGKMDIFDKQNEKILAIDTKVKEIEATFNFQVEEVKQELVVLDNKQGEAKKTVKHLYE